MMPMTRATGTVLLVSLALMSACSDEPPALTVQTYTSSPDFFAVSSYLIAGEKDAILVDGQFFTTDAQAVVDMVNASGKTLKTVFLTHAHGDHMFGLKVIQEAFPGAEFVTTQAVLNDFNIKGPVALQTVKASPVASLVPDALISLRAVSGALRLEGQSIELLDLPHPGESEASAALILESSRALISGDALYDKAHLFLGDCQEEGWQRNIDVIRARGFAEFYPGHGVKSGPGILDDNSRYIQEAVPILNAAATPEDAIAMISQKYPDYAAMQLLGFGTQQYFARCKP
jgi:glyoxylase-like metal-dependent hydrolase (beta-lactamase superfamily II)